MRRGGYRVLRTADGYLSLGAFSPRARSRLAVVLGLDDPAGVETGRYRAGVTPIGMSGTPYRPTSGSPTFGAHTRHVLTGLGLDGDQIDQLFADGIVAEGWPVP